MLCPDGVMAKPIKYIFGLIFILSVISAAAITVPNLDFSLPEASLSDASPAELESKAAEYVYAYALKDAGIDFTKITVCTDKTENGSISINKVIICSDCEKDRIIAALGEVAENIEVEVIND